MGRALRRALSEARERCHEVEGATIGPGPIGRFGAGYIVHFMDQLFQGSMGGKRHVKFPRTLEYQSQLPRMRKVPRRVLSSWLVQAVGLNLSYWHLRHIIDAIRATQKLCDYLDRAADRETTFHARAIQLVA